MSCRDQTAGFDVRVQRGDSISVGPTPLSKLLIEGTLEGKDNTNNTLILTIDNMAAPAGDEEPLH